MAAYKDKERNSWYCKFYYETWDGCKRQTTKRGFATKKAAVEWENEFKASVKAEMTMTMASFVDVYFKDKKGELKERSLKNKRYMIDVHILPYFGERKVKDITASDIIQWQNTIREKGFEPTYERMIQNPVKPVLLFPGEGILGVDIQEHPGNTDGLGQHHFQGNILPEGIQLPLVVEQIPHRGGVIHVSVVDTETAGGGDKILGC